MEVHDAVGRARPEEGVALAAGRGAPANAQLLAAGDATGSREVALLEARE